MLLDIFKKGTNKLLNMFIYTEMTLNPIRTFKLTIYNTKHTQHIKLYFPQYIFF